MKVKPLTGQVLVEILPVEKLTSGGLEIPEYSRTPDERHEASRRPEPPAPLTAIVREVGLWPKTKHGLAMLPEFHKGDKVLVQPYSGVTMQRNIGERFKMIRFDQVLMVVQDDASEMTSEDWDKFEKGALSDRRI